MSLSKELRNISDKIKDHDGQGMSKIIWLGGPSRQDRLILPGIKQYLMSGEKFSDYEYIAIVSSHQKNLGILTPDFYEVKPWIEKCLTKDRCTWFMPAIYLSDTTWTKNNRTSFGIHRIIGINTIDDSNMETCNVNK